MAIAFMCLVGGFAYADLNDSLFAHYKLDGNGTDSSGNGRHGTVSGATNGTDRFGNPNGALHFDGFNDNVEIPSLNNEPVLTLSVWAKAELGHSRRILVIISGDDYAYDRSLEL